MQEPKRYTLTAALPYANGPVHIGHIAGCYLPADIYHRYLKARGEDVIFICGSDEHGVPITLKAMKEGITPQQVVDKYNKLMKDAFDDFGIHFTYYGRTSSEIHHKTASDFFKNLYDKGVFSEEVTRQYYDPEAKQFLADRYITGTCPRCGNEKAYGDQCEKCGTSLNPTDLINPKSTLSGKEPELKETRNWFLPLDKFGPKLTEYIQSHKSDWKTNVYGQCMSWLNAGLQPRAMTRDLNWGVKVPVAGAENKVLYVWFDAPIGYISATREYFGNDEWKKYWTDPETKLIHFIGKDNIVFHCLIFPAMLMAHEDFILPGNVPANEFLNLEGDKISTSRNWAIWLHEYLIDFPGKQDELRYVLTSIAPETKDSDFTWKDYQARINNELVAILGNFINRVMVLSQKYYAGIVPSCEKNEFKDLLDVDIITSARIIKSNLDQFKFRDAQFALIDLARKGNKFLADNEPWKLIKTDIKTTEQILEASIQLCAHLAVLMEAFLPVTSQKIFEMIGLDQKSINKKDYWALNWTHLHLVSSKHQMSDAQLLFKPIEDDQIQAQINKLEANKVLQKEQNSENTQSSLQELKASINYDDFNKMDIRVATIIEAEKVPKADKLLKLLLDTGIDQRTVLSGIAEHFKPEEIIGKQVSVLVNLEPRKIRGIESNGMILMAEDLNGKLQFISPVNSIDNGSVIK